MRRSLSRSASLRCVLLSALMVSAIACQSETPSKAPAETTQPHAERAPGEVIGQEYYKAGPNPLAALYGSKRPLAERFKAVAHYEPSEPMPSAWRTSYAQLKRALKASGAEVKLTEWSSLERSRLDQRERDFDVRWQLNMFGSRKELKRALKGVWAPIRAFKGLVPPQEGDELEHLGRGGAYELKIEGSLEGREAKGEPQERVWLKVEVRWSRAAPAPTGERRNCRYASGLTPPSTLIPSWLEPYFKTTSARRFVEWSYQRGDAEAPRWTGLWVYRNGSLRDKGVGWLSEQLSQQGGSRAEMRGMQQTWTTPEGRSLTWWSESDPNELGCLLEAPLLALSWSEAQP